MAEVAKKRDVAIDLVKVFATFLVLNSHMGVCYEKYSFLATGGGIGDALFFFASGFTLFLGRKLDFVNWYKRRLGRIFPAIIAMCLFSCFLFGTEELFGDVITAKAYWFLRCILFCYVVLYPIIRYSLNLWVSFGAVALLVGIAFFQIDLNGSLFYGTDNYFRWLFYLAIMIAGGNVSTNSDKIIYRWYAFPMFLLSIVAWYGVLYLSHGGNLQILSSFPLIGICVFGYQIGKAQWVEKLFNMKGLGITLYTIGALCLESYLIQFSIISDRFNGIFPLNIPLVVFIVLLSAYALHIVAGVISQIFDSKPFEWKELFIHR